jgi:hypothetical protein
MWRIYRGLTPARAAIRFLLPFLFGAMFVVDATITIAAHMFSGGIVVLVVGAAIAGVSGYGLFRGLRNWGRSLDAISAEEHGVPDGARSRRAEVQAPFTGYRAPARVDETDAPIDLASLPLPKMCAAPGETLAVRLVRTESRRRELARTLVILGVLGLVAGMCTVGALHKNGGAIVIGLVTYVVCALALRALIVRLRAFRTPEPIVEIDREPAFLGTPLEVLVVQRGPAAKAMLEVELRCEEIATIQRGRSTSIERTRLASVNVGDQLIVEVHPGEARTVRWSAVLPDAPASFCLRGAMIEWTVIVRLRTNDADPNEDRFLFRVLPKEAT